MNHNGAHCTVPWGEASKICIFSIIIYVTVKDCQFPTESPTPPKIQPKKLKKATFQKDISKVCIVFNKGNKG